MFEDRSAVGSLRELWLRFCKIKIDYCLQYNFNPHTHQIYTPSITMGTLKIKV